MLLNAQQMPKNHEVTAAQLAPATGGDKGLVGEFALPMKLLLCRNRTCAGALDGLAVIQIGLCLTPIA